MPFNIKKINNAYKIHYIAGAGRPIKVSNLTNGSELLSLDYIDQNTGLPFTQVASKNQETLSLEVIDPISGKIFTGAKL